jgi:rare lipoprotein A
MKPSRRRIAIVGARATAALVEPTPRIMEIFCGAERNALRRVWTREGRSGIQYDASCFRGCDYCAGGRSADAGGRSIRIPQLLGLCAFYPAHGNGLTAAHRTLPFGTRVRVSDPKTGRSVTVTINDRGPFGKRRVLDLSPNAARALGMISRGVIYVKAEVL